MTLSNNNNCIFNSDNIVLGFSGLAASVDIFKIKNKNNMRLGTFEKYIYFHI